MSKGTIIYIGGFELPDKNAAAHRVIANAKILRKLQYDVVFIGVDKELKYHQDILNIKGNIQGFDSWSVPYPKTKKQWVHYLSSISDFKRIVGTYKDVKYVLCYNYQAVSFFRIRHYCKVKSIKIVGDCTEWYSTKGSNLAFKILKGLDSFIRMRLIQRRLDGLIVISRYLEKYYSNCKNTICIPPLVDKNEDKWRRSSQGDVNNKITIIYAGNPGNKDRINYIIDGLKLVNIPFKLNIIGITERQYLKLNPQHFNVLSELNKDIEFLGILSHLQTLDYIKKADFSCFLREENIVSLAGFPTKFVESISCATPVITNRTSDLSEYLVENKNGYFINLDSVDSVRDQFITLLNLDNKKILEMKMNCYTSNLFDYNNYIWLFKSIVD